VAAPWPLLARALLPEADCGAIETAFAWLEECDLAAE
jgi:hypothetical protein